jgi:uncharacterized protein
MNAGIVRHRAQPETAAMKLTAASRNQNFIRAYADHEVKVGERTTTSNCLITADHLEDWNVQSIAALSVADLQPIFALKPEIVILGTGVKQIFPSAAIQAAFLAREIGIEVMALGAACRTFNVLLSEDRKVLAALVLT